jgi:hypothetical protein
VEVPHRTSPLMQGTALAFPNTTLCIDEERTDSSNRLASSWRRTASPSSMEPCIRLKHKLCYTENERDCHACMHVEGVKLCTSAEHWPIEIAILD